MRYQHPRDIGQAVSLSLAVQEAERQEKFNKNFYTRFDNSVRLLSRSPSRPSREDRKSRRKMNKEAEGRTRSQRYDSPRNSSRPTNSVIRNAQTQAALRYYDFQGLGHFARECPTRLKRQENNRDPQGRGTARWRSVRSQPPDNSPSCRKTGSEKEFDYSGKRVDGVKGRSSFHLSTPDEAATTTPFSIFL